MGAERAAGVTTGRPEARPGTVRVRIRYLSAVRDRTGGTRVDEVDFPAGSSLAAVSEWLARRYGLKVPDASLMSTVNGFGWNQASQGPASEIHEGDEIALFPLLSGG